MKQIRVSDLFDVRYGVNLELNKLTHNEDGFNFVSRTSKNNGVSAKVSPLENIKPIPEGTISVACGGSVMESFLQPEPYYSGRDLYYLVPKVELTDREKLFYCSCLKANQYRFNYGRQANRTLRDLLIPDLEEIPLWVKDIDLNRFDDSKKAFNLDPAPVLGPSTWKWFILGELFDIKKGKRLTKANMTKGAIPFIGSIATNNGYREFIGQKPIHDGGTITVNYNGSIAEAFYQPKPFWASDDVNVLYPKFEMNQYIALFITTIIKLEKHRFNYGRKWHLERMKTSKIRLPSTESGAPDLDYMEEFIKHLQFSKHI